MTSAIDSAALPRRVDPDARLYLRPHGLSGGAALSWASLEVIVREGAAIRRFEVDADGADLLAWAGEHGPGLLTQAEARLAGLRHPREIAGLSIDEPVVMGVVNVTPDSFSDGGDHLDPSVAIAAGRDMASRGAGIIDVGGESTRPGARQPDGSLEAARVLPVIEALAGAGLYVSVDTRRAAVMRAALAAGAQMVNDVSALGADAESLAVAAAASCPVVLMHMQGTPETMQDNPTYEAAPLDIHDWLEARIAACDAAGISRARIIVDPGIGFGKTLEHNLEILQDIAVLHGLGCPLAVGVSRKAFIGKLTGESEPKGRLAGSLAAMLHAVGEGAHIVRVHDVAESANALAVRRTLRRNPGGGRK